MPVYPADNTDTVLYNGADLYAAKDCSVTVFEDSRMFLFGEWYLNGQPIMAGPSAPSGIEVYVGPTQPVDPGVMLWWDVTASSWGVLKVKTGGTWRATTDPQISTDANEVWLGPTQPVGPNYEVWIDTTTLSVKGLVGGNWVAMSVGPQGPKGDKGDKGDPGGVLTDGDKGDITLTSSASVWTIDPNAINTAKISDAVVTNAKLAAAAANSLKGNNTGASATPVDLTVPQVKTLLSIDNVDNTADVNKALFTTTIRGLTPPPAAITSKYLKDDGTWSDLPTRYTVLTKATAYTPVGTDANKLLMMTSASAVNVTLLGSNFTVGDRIVFAQSGAGQVTFVPGASNFIYTAPGTAPKTTGQSSTNIPVVTAIYLTTNNWVLFGDLAPEDWTLVTYQNGWTSFGFGWGAAAFARVGDGLVKLRGLMAPGTKRVASFTLPVGYRPGNKEMYTVIVAEGTPPIMGEFIVQADGQCILQNPNDTSVVFVSLSNISFIPV
jgi:hypothetical protein